MGFSAILKIDDDEEKVEFALFRVFFSFSAFFGVYWKIKLTF